MLSFSVKGVTGKLTVFLHTSPENIQLLVEDSY